MFTPDDLRVRHFRPTDQGEVLRMVGGENNNKWPSCGKSMCVGVVFFSLKMTPSPPPIQINYIQGEEENAELRRQIKLMFLNPWLWAAAAVAICVVGISLE